MAVADLFRGLVGEAPAIAFACYDGSRLGPSDAPVTIVVRSPDALRRIVTSPNELGFGRAYVAGDLDVEGDIFAALALRDQLRDAALRPSIIADIVRAAGLRVLRPLRPPPEEARLRGKLHSKARDAAAISYHYDVSNKFYDIVLGPSLAYSCAVWTDGTPSLEIAQQNKHELVCAKLALEPGMRLLDVGCGWGSMLLHAARHHGVRGVGVTLSHRQTELAAKRIADAGLSERIEIRYQDYRDVADGPFDAISSIGMFEHVGRSRLKAYFDRLAALLRPGGRLLNHGISRRPYASSLERVLPVRLRQRGDFINRYVFPDGELHEVGEVVSVVQQAGLEVRHVESLREHYSRTLRQWVANLEAGWDDAVREVGVARARVWRLYMAVAATLFDDGDLAIHQVLATNSVDGLSCMPLRPQFA